MQAKDQVAIEFTLGRDPLTRRCLDTTQSREEGVSLDPMGEQSGISQITSHSSLPSQSGSRGPIYSSWGEGIQQESTQGCSLPAGAVVPLGMRGSTAQAVVPLVYVR